MCMNGCESVYSKCNVSGKIWFYSANTKTGTGHANKIHKFERCFLRGQVRSNGYFRGRTVEP